MDSQLGRPPIHKPHNVPSRSSTSAPTRPAPPTPATPSTLRSPPGPPSTAVFIPEGEFQLNRHVVLPNNVTLDRRRQLVHDHHRPPDPGDRPRRLGRPHRPRHLRQVRRRRRQPERPHLELRHQGRRTGAARPRPGQRHRRCARRRLDRHRPVHRPHQGRPVVRRPVQRAHRHEQRDRQPDRGRPQPAQGVSHVLVQNNFFRNTGDDGMAMWSENAADHDNRFDHNTVQTPVLANGIAIYGGRDNTVSNNLVADPIREGSGLQVGSRFGATPFAGQPEVRRQHHGPGRHLRAQLEHRPRRDLDLRPGELDQRRTSRSRTTTSSTTPTTRSCWCPTSR